MRRAARDDLPAVLLEPAVSAGHVWLAERGGEAAGTVTLTPVDVLWPDDGTALYVHRLAVRRRAAGLGVALLAHAAATATAAGCDRLRLDCMADNAVLRAYYVRTGFRHVGDVEVPRAAIRWSVAAPVVSLFERVLRS